MGPRRPLRRPGGSREAEGPRPRRRLQQLPQPQRPGHRDLPRRPRPHPHRPDRNNRGVETMNRNDTTTRASAPTPAPVSRASGTPLGTTHFLTLAAARTAADVAMSSALAKGYPVSVTVVDRDGIVIAQQRADTATGATVQVSLSRAAAAVGFQMPTSAIQDYAKTNPGAVYIQG